MTGYFLADVLDVSDPAAMDRYRAQVHNTVAFHGGRYLSVGGTIEIAEGGWAPRALVLIEFPTLEAAHNWYESDAYAGLKSLRLSASRANALFLEGREWTGPQGAAAQHDGAAVS